MSESTVPSIRPERTHIVTLPGTSSSGTIADVGTPDFSTGPRNRSTTSIWTGSTQHELTVNRLSGKLGAHHSAKRGSAVKSVCGSGPVLPALRGSLVGLQRRRAQPQSAYTSHFRNPVFEAIFHSPL